jgi:imidazolonepropionase-like amidohydrolase
MRRRREVELACLRFFDHSLQEPHNHRSGTNLLNRQARHLGDCFTPIFQECTVIPRLLGVMTSPAFGGNFVRSLFVDLMSFILLSSCLGAVAANAQERIAIKAGRLIDGTGAPAIEQAVVIVRGERIEAVGRASSIPIPEGVKVIDLSADTVMPGMIDGHSHPTVRNYTGDKPKRIGPNSLLQELGMMEEPSAMQAARGVRNLRVDLLAGVTSDYVVGEVGGNDIYLKRMADAGVIPAPRMYLSGPWIMPTGGFSPIPETNGPWAMRTMVRENFEQGAHHIKILISSSMPTGPNAGRSYAPGATNFTKEELDAVVDEAHRLGMKVTAHAMDAYSTRLALEAGADSIQHASDLTPEVVGSFLKYHAGFINTYAVFFGDSFTPLDWYYLDAEANSPQEWVDHARAIRDMANAQNQRSQESLKERYAQLKMAKSKGIPIGVGTDDMHGLLDIEIEHLVSAGFTPLEAIGAATGTGARVLGIDKEVGTLETEKYADIISIRGRPDENIRDLGKVNFIMVGGKIYSGLSFR